jgi:hypothetical protein
VKELPSGGLSEIVISIGVPFSILSKFYRVFDTIQLHCYKCRCLLYP